jgi:hypothetical protein
MLLTAASDLLCTHHLLCAFSDQFLEPFMSNLHLYKHIKKICIEINWSLFIFFELRLQFIWTPFDPKTLKLFSGMACSKRPHKRAIKSEEETHVKDKLESHNFEIKK